MTMEFTEIENFQFLRVNILNFTIRRRNEGIRGEVPPFCRSCCEPLISLPESPVNNPFNKCLFKSGQLLPNRFSTQRHKRAADFTTGGSFAPE
ncbi:hypothetical protein CDAR_437511 [Caerostris darwini]|uniref:Uncharacterized protein n=1 Tax=Caerostris darwini TaxID=1538125 RepID=A0AAV4NVC3_9ARAC|nr:hypothetical protein CDAR_437511 [Caerostris darwini]